MTGQIYICVSGGLVRDVLTDDRRLLKTPITIVDHDCEPHTGSHLVSYDNQSAEHGDVWREKPRLCSVDIVKNGDVES